MNTVVAALLAGAAAAVLLPRHSGARLSVVLARHPAGARRAAVAPAAAHPVPAAHVSPATVLLASGAGGLGVGAVVGGTVGLLVGAGAAVGCAVVLRRLEPRAVRERRERLAADLPPAVDLLGACLTVGRPPAHALDAVAAAVGGPLARELGLLSARLRLGADPVAVWRGVADRAGPLAPLGRTMARSLETGAPMADGLALLAADLRRRRRAAAEQRARSVGVHAAAPLGLCFLPAFLLIGIVPSVVGAFTSMSWW